ncbi:MAG: class I SAM-dependent methyltransferase, partial [Candidatus Sumerlaeota bacterium]|nr:class I SAM-dependent methyltransferase [Candidatus Sumerlaeota bacterium]
MTYTRQTREYLDCVFSYPAQEGEGYQAHEPLYGFGGRRSHPGHAVRMARTARILRLLAREEFKDFLDVGAGEAYTADLVRQWFEVPVAACDLSLEGCRRGRELLGVPTFSCDAARLPLPDAAFDCVLCSETLEHLEFPFVALEELLRVTRKVLMLTTLECASGEGRRRLLLKLRDFAKPHLEINIWTPQDFRGLLGADIETHRQYRPHGAPPDTETDMTTVKRWLRSATDARALERHGVGIIVLWRRTAPASTAPASIAPASAGNAASTGTAFPTPATAADRDRRIAELNSDALWDCLLAPRPLGRRVTSEEEQWLEARLRCPICRNNLTKDCEKGFACEICHCIWPVSHEVANLMGARASSPATQGPKNSVGENARKSESEGVGEFARGGASQIAGDIARDAGGDARAPRLKTVAKLQRLFSPENVWTGKKALAGRAVRALADLASDIKTQRGLKPSLAAFVGTLREIARELHPRAEGMLVRARGDQFIYRIESGQRRRIVSDKVFYARGYNLDQVKIVDPIWLEHFP